MSLRFPKSRGKDRHPVNVRHMGARRTFGERVADRIAAGVGSWPFIITQSVLLAAWILANGLLIMAWLGGKPFDPYPFILLNLVLSFQAAYTGPVVLMSQNRQAAKDRDEAEHDYEINREALDRLRRLEEGQGRIQELLDRLAPSRNPEPPSPPGAP
jgi:uncharacterized membrane protein